MFGRTERGVNHPSLFFSAPPWCDQGLKTKALSLLQKSGKLRMPS
jgi:hypothetical protein